MIDIISMQLISVSARCNSHRSSNKTFSRHSQEKKTLFATIRYISMNWNIYWTQRINLLSLSIVNQMNDSNSLKRNICILLSVWESIWHLILSLYHKTNYLKRLNKEVEGWRDMQECINRFYYLLLFVKNMNQWRWISLQNFHAYPFEYFVSFMQGEFAYIKSYGLYIILLMIYRFDIYFDSFLSKWYHQCILRWFKVKRMCNIYWRSYFWNSII